MRLSVTTLALWAALAPATAIAQESLDPERDAMYARYLTIPSLVKGGTVCSDAGLLGGAPCSVNWMPDGQSFWFAEGQPDQTVIRVFDPERAVTEPLFDTERVRAGLEQALGYRPPYQGLPFDGFTFVGDGMDSVRFTFDDRSFRMDLTDYVVSPIASAETEAAARAAPRVVRQGFTSGAPAVMEVPSPDGRWLLTEKDDDLWIRASFDGREQPVMEDGEEDYAWRVQGAMWAPDGARAAVMKVDARRMPRVPILHWLKQTEEVEYAPFSKAGNPYRRQEVHIVDVHGRQSVAVDVGDEDQLLSPVGWLPDGSEFLFLRMLRSYQTLHLVAADPATGETRVVLEETKPTFIKGIGTTPSWRSLARPLSDGERFLWISERDGWDHLYLYGMDGRLLARLTEGEWPVLGVVHVDEDGGYVYFTAHREERLYDTHLYRVPLSGGDVVRLTEGEGQHSAAISPNGAFVVDTHSSTSRPPRTEVRTTTGEWVAMVTEADVSALDELAWSPPEEFVVKAADGETDLYGLIYKPHDFDPGAKGEFKRSSQHLREMLRWQRAGTEERIEPYVHGCVHQAVRRWDAASIGRGSGKRSLEVCRARRPPWQRVCPLLSGHAGFANVVACHHSIFVPSHGAISRSLSEKRSPFFEPVVVACARSPGSWAAHPRRSRENCGATQLQEEGTSSIGPRPLNGTPTGERNVQSLRSSLRTAN